jgi:hypothetical protein
VVSDAYYARLWAQIRAMAKAGHVDFTQLDRDLCPRCGDLDFAREHQRDVKEDDLNSRNGGW